MIQAEEMGKVNSDTEISMVLEPVGDLSSIAGYLAPASIMTSELKTTSSSKNTPDRAKLLKLASKILENPLLQQQMSHRVYQLMQEDLYRQKERSINL